MNISTLADSNSTLAAVDIVDVTKRFEGSTVPALKDVVLQIRRNEFFTLLGPSGCGKTTLLRLIAGFEQPTSGNILLEGEQVAGLPAFRRQVNTVFQSYALFPHLSVDQNIAFGLEMQGLPKHEIDETVTRMLALVNLGALKNRMPSELSGGQQQRVALARALACRPKVLLLDEPLSALDHKLRRKMQVELKKLQLEAGITFVFVTHDQEEALTMSDRIAVMSTGEVMQVGDPAEIYNKPTSRFVADFIGDSNLLQVKVKRSDSGGTLVRHSTGFEMSADNKNMGNVGQDVTVVFRPERAEISREIDEGSLIGTVNEIVYFGTDTMYHVTLKSGEVVRARRQNRQPLTPAIQSGDTLGLKITPGAAHVIEE